MPVKKRERSTAGSNRQDTSDPVLTVHRSAMSELERLGMNPKILLFSREERACLGDCPLGRLADLVDGALALLSGGEDPPSEGAVHAAVGTLIEASALTTGRLANGDRAVRARRTVRQ